MNTQTMLFDAAPDDEVSDAFHNAPLAERMRPKTLAEVIGQEEATGEQGVLTRMAAARKLQSFILWGPPGCGKTTIARIVAGEAGYTLLQVSAVASGVAELKKHFEQARALAAMGKRPVLFVDEIHRFNRAQQDVLLPVMEDGTITLIGATTENPSFELNAALLSRARVVVLKRLDEVALEKLVDRVESRESSKLPMNDEARAMLIAMADGDGRFLLNMVEMIVSALPTLAGGDGGGNLLASNVALDIPSPNPSRKREGNILDTAALTALLQKRAAVYDKAADSHYNLMSALHKSMRGSDVDAALYWFGRMLEGGEDPRYIARRLIRFAAEDVGMADPQALTQAIAGADMVERLGSPEGELGLVQALVYLATAPKSNAQYSAYKAARLAAKEHGSLMPPKHILNAPTKMMKELGYGAGYAYDHDTDAGFSGQNYFPDTMPREVFYQPVERGFEREVKKRLEYWAKLRG